MNSDAFFLLAFLVAFAVLVVAVLWLLVQIGRLGRRVEQGLADQHLQLVKELQATSLAGSDRVIDLVAAEVDNLRDRLDAIDSCADVRELVDLTLLD